MENFTDEREDYSFSVDFEILQNCFWDHVLWWNTNTRVQRNGTYENKRFENENRGSKFRPMLISLNWNLNPIIEGNPRRVITQAITTIRLPILFSITEKCSWILCSNIHMLIYLTRYIPIYIRWLLIIVQNFKRFCFRNLLRNIQNIIEIIFYFVVR